MLVASRVLLAINAQSVATVEDQVTLPQLRVLVMITSRGPQNLSSVAQGLGVHPSYATRICDKLVEEGLVRRSENLANRRKLILQLTESGQQLIDTITERRRTAIANILDAMPTGHRDDLASSLLVFAEAAGEIPESQAWSLGWTTTQPHDTIGDSGKPHPHPCRPECGHQPG